MGSGYGFRIDYHPTNVATPFRLGNLRYGACGGNFTTPSGLLTSPSYPDKYPENADCEYTISQKNGTYITLIILNMDIKIPRDTGTCYDEYLEIRNGNSDESALLGKLCGNDAPPIQSTGSNLWLR